MPSDHPAHRNVALLIDADNASWHGIDPVLTALAEFGSVNVRRIYGNWSKEGLKGWRDMTVKHGIEPHQQFDLTKGKNATDMKMTIDAMDLLYRGRVHAFGIMSSDSDFMPLATRIRQDGLDVYGFGSATRAPEGFKAACTRFIDVDALMATNEKPKRAPRMVEVPLGESMPPPIAPTPKPAAGGVNDPELLAMIQDAYALQNRDARGFVALGSLGQMVSNRSSFDVRNYGFKRLSDLFEAIPAMEVERRDNHVFVRFKDKE